MTSIKVDLRNRLGDARDQGRRMTCIAFAASDCHAANREPSVGELSVEYAFYHALRHKGGTLDPYAGVGANHILKAIEVDGQPEESAWPYLPSVPLDISMYAPPKDPGTLYHMSGALHVTGDVSALCSELNKGNAAVVLFMPTEQFHRATAGTIMRYTPHDSPTGLGHAVLAVGWGEVGPSGVAILVRNSWGKKWADEGHVWMEEDYLKARMIGFLAMR